MSSFAGDNLTLIKGVGPKIAIRLHNTGILTFAQLAKLSPEDIAARVKGLSTKRITRENWIKQARKLARKTVSIQTQSGEATSRFRQHYATFTLELLLDEENRARRTRVTYVQNKITETWAGWEQLRLTDFFVRSAGLHLPTHESAILEEPLPSRESTPLSKAILPPLQTAKFPSGELLPH
jgi:predicted RecB family nuclease